MKKKQSNIIILGMLTTVTVLTWISMEAYRILNKKELQTVPQNTLTPLDPTLNTEALKTIQNRRFFDEQEVNALGKPQFKGEKTTSPQTQLESTPSGEQSQTQGE